MREDSEGCGPEHDIKLFMSIQIQLQYKTVARKKIRVVRESYTLTLSTTLKRMLLYLIVTILFYQEI